MPDPEAFGFGSFRLMSKRRELLLNGDSIQLGSRAFDLLLALVKRQGQLATKDELMAEVWPGTIVEENSLHAQISALRKVLAGDPDSTYYLQTIPGRGYRFVARVEHVTADHVTAPTTSSAAPLPLPDKPSIAVLPFTNMSGDLGQEYFADGMVEDIITELSRFGELFVIARNSSFQYRGKAVDVRQVGRELGVRYVLEGSVRRGGDRVRVAAQLIDAESGGHLWAEKYEHDYSHVFALQDEVTQSVVGAIQPQILVGEGRRAARKSPTNLDAFDSIMRGMWHIHQRTPHDNRLAESWFTRSIELDPTLARAHVMLSRVLAGRCWVGDSDDIERDLHASLAAAERAVALDERDAAGQYALSIISLMMRRHERALGAAERAIDLNPNLALGHFALGETRLFMGQFGEALNSLMRCLRLSPHDPLASSFVSFIALAHYHLGNYKEAVHHSERALQKRRTYFVLRTLAAALGQLGRIEEVRPVLAEMERIKPTNERHWALIRPYADPAYEAQILDSLRMA